MLVLLPMMTLFRIAQDGPRDSKFAGMAGFLLAMAVMSMFVPALVFVFPSWKPLLKTSQTPVLFLLLIFLLYWGRYERRVWTDDYRVSHGKANHAPHTTRHQSA
jgi:hypothetical protein